MSLKLFLFYIAFVLLLACQQADNSSVDTATTRSTPTTISSVYAAAVAAPDRLAVDYERDGDRKPAATLQFMGIKSGQTVLDLFSGGGYYVELISRVVGPEGKVFAHTNETYIGYAGEEYLNRYKNGRLGNVEILLAENNELELDESSLDVVTIILSYHDVYYVNPEGGWPKFDVEKFNAEIYKGLKPGGALVIVDHMAKPGSPRATGGTVHRIDSAAVIEDFESAGFILDATSDVLQNPDDDYSKSVFDKSVRGKTDRFALRFVKPE